MTKTDDVLWLLLASTDINEVLYEINPITKCFRMVFIKRLVISLSYYYALLFFKKA